MSDNLSDRFDAVITYKHSRDLRTRPAIHGTELQSFELFRPDQGRPNCSWILDTPYELFVESIYYYHNWYLSKSRLEIKIKGPYANVKLEIESGKLNRQLPDISKIQNSDFRFFSDIVQDRFLAVKIQKGPTLKLILIKIFRRNYISEVLMQNKFFIQNV